MALPTEQQDQMVYYDRAVLTMFDALPVKPNGRPLRVVFASPERAFATAKEVWGDETGDARTSILPMLSIERQDINYDPDRYRPEKAKMRSHILGFQDETQETGNAASFPIPVDISYQADIWTRTRQTLNQIQLAIAQSILRHRPAFLRIDLSNIWEEWSDKIVPLETEGFSDNSSLEQEEEEREIRSTWSFTLKGWVLPTLEATKTVLNTQVDTYMFTDLSETKTIDDLGEGEQVSSTITDEEGRTK